MLSSQLPALQSNELVQQWLANSMFQRDMPKLHRLSAHGKQFRTTIPSPHTHTKVRDETKINSPIHDEHEDKVFVSIESPRSQHRVPSYSRLIAQVNIRQPTSILPQNERHREKSTGIQLDQGCLDPSEKYGRRQRNKTKDDRYELKEPTSRQQARISKRRNHHKPSATLKEDFHAPNVYAKRLTLKPTLGPGIFAKGKASLPTEMQGLPDLTFSEMRFLGKQRHDNGRRQIVHPHSHVLKRAKTTPSEEISRFFSRSGEGDASPNSERLTPARATEDDASRAQVTEVFARKDDALGENSCTRSIASQPVTSTNVISWSVSPSRHRHCPKGEQQQWTSIPAASLHAARFQSRASHYGAPITPTVHPMSSASNSLFRQHTDYVLMSDVKKWSQQNKQYLSLDDLKRLATRTGRHETVFCEDKDHCRDSKPYLPSVGSELANGCTYRLELTGNEIDIRNRFSGSSASRPLENKGRGGAEHRIQRALSRHSSELWMGQSGPFRPPSSNSHGDHVESCWLKDPTPNVLTTNANASAQRLLVPLNQGPPISQSSDGMFHALGHENRVEKSHLDDIYDDTDSRNAPEHDLDSLDQFDIQLLGIDCSGDAVSTKLVNGSEMAVYEPSSVKDFHSNVDLSDNPGSPKVDNTHDSSSDRTVNGRYLEEGVLMRSPNHWPMSMSHPLGNAVGLISYTLDEPSEEVFTGLSRPHVLY